MSWAMRIPPAEEIQGVPALWKRVSRTEALRLHRYRPVAVIAMVQGFPSVTWLDAGSPFLHSAGPYDYASLRYFAWAGGAASASAAGGGGRKSQPTKGKPVEEEEEELVPLEEEPEAGTPKGPSAGKGASAGMPALAAGLTGTLGLAGAKGDLQAAEAIRDQVADQVGDQALPDLPGVPDKPDKPAIPEKPDVPAKPDLPPIPGQAAKKLPIEIQVVDARGEPMPSAAFALTLPDGTVLKGKSDGEGMIRMPDNTLEGEVELVLDL